MMPAVTEWDRALVLRVTKNREQTGKLVRHLAHFIGRRGWEQFCRRCLNYVFPIKAYVI